MRKHTKAWIISKLNSLRVNNSRMSGIDCFRKVIKASRMSLAVYLSSPAVVNLWHFHQKLEPLFWWLINTFTKFLKHTFSLVHFFYPVKDFAGRGLTWKKVACKSESHTLLLNSSRESKVIVLPFLSLLILCDNLSVRSFSALETSGFCSRSKHVEDIFPVSKACQSNHQRGSMHAFKLAKAKLVR